MAIAFFNSIYGDFYNKLYDSSNLDDLIDVCVDYVHEFFSVIQIFTVFVTIIWKTVR